MKALDKVTSALRRLHLSSNEQKIYLSLLREGRAPARVLAARTGMTRPSVYDQLKSLRRQGLVVELDIEGKTFFAAGNIKQLDALLADQIDRIEQSRTFLADALPTLLESLDSVDPRIRFFEAEEGMKQLLKDIMWHDKETLLMVWNHAAMADVFDSAFVDWFDERRAKRDLSALVLWPAGTKKSEQTLFCTHPDDTARVMPKAMTGSMTTIIYGHKVAFISSSRETFGFIVESKEFSDAERVKFATLWQAA